MPATAGSQLGGTDGFTIVEVLVAIILLIVGILGALIMINSANGTTLANQVRTGGVNLAREVAEGSERSATQSPIRRFPRVVRRRRAPPTRVRSQA